MLSEQTKSKTLLWGDYLVIVVYFLFVLFVGLWVNTVGTCLDNQTLTLIIMIIRPRGNQKEAVSAVTSWLPEA